MNTTTASIRNYMLANVDAYVDEFGDVNATGLAEDACQHFNGYQGDDIPDEYFDFAAEIALEHEYKKAENQYNAGRYATDPEELPF